MSDNGFNIAPYRKEQDVKICAALGVPRVGYNDFWGCVAHALMPFRIPLTTYTGCFWSQQMENALEDIAEAGNDWALCLDYDATFTRDHVEALLKCIPLHPYADAIAALQRKRNTIDPIMSLSDGKQGALEHGMMEAATAHFGFTLIRCACLEHLPKPWLWEQPNAEGRWREGATYPDEYFWEQWRKCGYSLYVNTDIRIGHLELVVSDYDESLQPRSAYVGDWFRAQPKGSTVSRVTTR